MTDDIFDRIDALVDAQLQQEPSGYDHNINQDRCRCGRDWHGLPITQRIDSMRSYGEFEPDYTFAADDSPVMCVGSNTPGPWRGNPLDASAWFDPSVWAAMSPWSQLRQRMDSGYRIPDLTPPVRQQVYEGPRAGQWWRCDDLQHLEVEISHDCDRDDLRSGLDYSARHHRAVMRITTPPDPNRDPFVADMNRRTEIVRLGFDPETHNYMRFEEVNRRPVWLEVFTDRCPPIGDWRPTNLPSAGELIRAAITMGIEHEEPEPDTRTPQQRALPRPSTAPPMWAADVNRTRRPRRHHNQPNRQATR